LLVLYVVAEINRPQPLSWKITLSKDDRNPYGAYILFNRLQDLFPGTPINTLREPAYNFIHDNSLKNTAYVVVAPHFEIGKPDQDELLGFVNDGNYVFISAASINKKFLDTLGLETLDFTDFWMKDSTAINFVNPELKADSSYRYRRFTVDGRFSAVNKPDSTTILGTTHKSDPNFVRVEFGSGAVYIHAAPLCFSNYFMLYRDNHEYASRALSYLPDDVSAVYWDEYYKLGRTGATTPLRFFLNDHWLRIALWLSIAALVIYVLFEMKRRQRIIPVIEPLRNSTIDFVKTVSAVYLGQKDNRSIANSKVQYWLQYIRRRYYLQTRELNDEFVTVLAKRSGVAEEKVREIIAIISEIEGSHPVSDQVLLRLNYRIDNFYISSKT
jgi:hypothetical protein